MTSADAEQEPPRIRVAAPEARRLAHDVLRGHGVTAEHAALVAADLRGVDTHGINKIPSYCRRIRQGVLDAAAVEVARVYGIGLAVKHSNHFGMSAWLVQQALDAGMMSLVFTNSSPAMPPWGGCSKLLGVSPIACGAPGGADGGADFVLDMAPSVAARGKIYKAQRRGERIPPGWALDAQGNATEDPTEALAGVMLPMGGPKGSILSIIMDVFAGVLSGAAFSGDVTNPYDPSSPADVGHFLVSIKPDLFMSADDFRARMRTLYDRVVSCEPAAGVDRIYFPGELEHLAQRERETSGIPLVQAEIDALNKEAARVSAEPLKMMS